eukprot:14229743-Ditylum_brightwellii.AAC.1
MQGTLSGAKGACAQGRWGRRGIFALQGWKEPALKEDGEVGASSRHSEMPVSSEEFTCIDDCLEVKELASREDVE